MAIPVKLEVFEGPLDLLLHLIEKNKIDIYDIPIVEITDQYLEYIQLMQEFDLEVASEFITMAAQLMYIKSKMLLPVYDDEPEEDPRAGLVEALLEYQRIKSAGTVLNSRAELGRDAFCIGKQGQNPGDPSLCLRLDIQVCLVDAVLGTGGGVVPDHDPHRTGPSLGQIAFPGEGVEVLVAHRRLCGACLRFGRQGQYSPLR